MAERPKVSDVVLHPVRLRVLQVTGCRRMTTADYRSALPDVAQATLYRHLSALAEAGFLQVVGERRVRGAVERTYAMGERLATVDRSELAAMTQEQLRAGFLTFLQQIARGFDAAVDAGPHARDRLGFGLTVLYVDTADIERIQQGFADLITPHAQEVPGKTRITLATAVIPDAEIR